MNCPRTLVVTSCTGKKKFKPDNQLKQEDFLDRSLLQSRTQELARYICDAGSIYKGMQHLKLMEGVAVLRQQLGKEKIDVAIISAGYGVITEEEKIVPYEVTFNNMKLGEVDEWSEFLDIHFCFAKIVADYELIFVLLGEKYLRALKLPVAANSKQTFIFLTSAGSKKYIKIDCAKSLIIPLSNADAKNYGYGLVGLKGFLFKQFAERAVENPDLLDKVHYNLEYFKQVIDEMNSTIQEATNSEDSSQFLQLELSLGLQKEASQKKEKSSKLIKTKKTKTKNTHSNDLLPIHKLSLAPNIHLGMKYFIPEWDDLVDPKYDFKTDTITPNRDTLRDDVYAHQIYQTPNYDGILVSKTVIGKSKKKKELIEKLGIHKFLDWPAEIMGDCGAFSYLQEEKPPYTTEEILDYYQSHGFNYGISVDHLIVGSYAKEGIREFRYDLTLKNAEDFINKHKSRGCNFTPIGAAQGWSPESYRDAVKELIGMGYDYIAVGGVARAKSEEIIAILQSIRPYLTASTRLHLLGVGRINVTSYFRHRGVTSFDSASPLRKAWLDPQTNYYTPSGKTYIAVRIPSSNAKSGKIKRVLEAGLSDRKTLKKLEDRAINSLRKFDAGSISLSEALEAILAYDKLLILPENEKNKSQNSARRFHTRNEYKRLLEDKPWQMCYCAVCQEIGVEAIIFRGNDRNRRRGFHNTYIFNQRFQELLESATNQKHG